MSDKLYFSMSLAEFHYTVLQLGLAWAVRDATTAQNEAASIEKFSLACRNLVPEIENAYKELGPEAADRFMRRLIRSAREVWGDDVRLQIEERTGPIAPQAKGAMPA